MFSRRVALSLAMLAAGAGFLTAGAIAGGSRSTVRNDGTFRIAVVGANLDFIDPALSYTAEGWALLDPTCARLMRYPDRPPPRGFRLQPEVATRYPRVSNDARMFTFTLRRGFRFSNGTRVTASAFARAIERIQAPDYKDSPARQYTDDIAGVAANGNRLVIRLKHPTPDLPARTTMPFFCAVPPSLPVDPEGVPAPLPGAGPYYIAEYVPGRRAVLKRNRFYRGDRPHHVDSFVADLTAADFGDVLARVDRGAADWAIDPIAPTYFQAGLDRKYGVNRSRFFVKPGLFLRAFALNTSRPLFRDARMRHAANFAIDRAAIRGVTPGGQRISTLTDHYLPPSLPGYRDAKIYPPRPNVRKARALARGHTGSGKAVIYTPPGLPIAFGQVAKRNLERIGVEAEVRAVPRLSDRINEPGERWDLAWVGWIADYADPYTYLNLLFDGRFVGRGNASRFDSPKYNRRLRSTARVIGAKRYPAYGRLDARLARAAAPMVAIDYLNEATLISRRVDRRCLVLRPGLDLTAVCLK